MMKLFAQTKKKWNYTKKPKKEKSIQTMSDETKPKEKRKVWLGRNTEPTKIKPNRQNCTGEPI